MATTIETGLKEVLGTIQGELKEIRNDLTNLKVSQAEYSVLKNLLEFTVNRF